MITYNSADGLDITASKCVDRSSFCGRYKRTDCPTSKSAVVSTIKVSNIGKSPTSINLLADGTLTFDAAGGCINPAPVDTNGIPTNGAVFQDYQDKSKAWITSTPKGVDLASANGVTVMGGTIEPKCHCTNGVAATSSCMAHEDAHCVFCDEGYFLASKECRAFTVCKAGQHQTTAPVQTTQNRKCEDNIAGTFTSSANQVTATPWKTCEAGEGQINAPDQMPSATTNRVCGECKLGTSFSGADDGSPCTLADVCTGGEYEKVAATLKADRTCATHADACASHEYETQAPGSHQDRECAQKVCHCPNGVHTTGEACPKHGNPKCSSCTGAYHLANGNNQCDANICSCEHGAVATGTACGVHGATKCMSCNSGYYLVGQDCVITYSWSKTAATCPTACGNAASTPADSYDDCVGSDGSTGNTGSLCGTKPSTTTSCDPTPSCYTYGFSKTAATCPTKCGIAASAPADTYTCIRTTVASGSTTTVADTSCGTMPSTTTSCNATPSCGYIKKYSGMCGDFAIKDKAECETAAAYVGHYDKGAQTEHAFDWQHGCYSYQGKYLWHNTHENDNACSNTHPCICKINPDDPEHSITAALALVKSRGLQVGGAGYNFEGNYIWKGLYCYNSGSSTYNGMCFFGTGGSSDDETKPVSGSRYRLA
jgi:hypothetical protein